MEKHYHLYAILGRFASSLTNTQRPENPPAAYLDFRTLETHRNIVISWKQVYDGEESDLALAEATMAKLAMLRLSLAAGNP